jgi:hypothetical protein
VTGGRGEGIKGLEGRKKGESGEGK